MIVFDNIKRKVLTWWRPVELSEVKTPNDTKAQFDLSLHNIHIGVLTLENGQWVFKYTDEFRQQSALQPLINFPNKEKIYSSAQLWPFFAGRIPGPGQPVVKAFLHKEGIEEPNEVMLLKEFGKRTIANPYVLMSL
ncbi:MAG: HipA N-terminal domain-containing protein [Bacteroidetes bacterium]|nr:HipA N-terminal domain-containing protein [Bacteroidota bacterium]